MKVILLQDVAKIGRRLEIVEVPNGFAQNKLIPQKLATEATPANVKQVMARSEKLSAQAAADAAALTAAIEALGGRTVIVSVPANENGHLFQALRADRIADALAAEGAAIPAGNIRVEAPIKAVGTHAVTVVTGDTEKEIAIEVTAE